VSHTRHLEAAYLRALAERGAADGIATPPS
jgi:hypothetical protein